MDDYHLTYNGYLDTHVMKRLGLICEDAFGARRENWFEFQIGDVNQPPEYLHALSSSKIEVAENLQAGSYTV